MDLFFFCVLDPFVPPNVYIGNVCTINISLIEDHCIHKKECSVGTGAPPSPCPPGAGRGERATVTVSRSFSTDCPPLSTDWCGHDSARACRTVGQGEVEVDAPGLAVLAKAAKLKRGTRSCI